MVYENLVSLFYEIDKKLEFYSKTMIHVPDTRVLITICLNDFFSKYVWH